MWRLSFTSGANAISSLVEYTMECPFRLFDLHSFQRLYAIFLPLTLHVNLDFDLVRFFVNNPIIFFTVNATVFPN